MPAQDSYRCRGCQDSLLASSALLASSWSAPLASRAPASAASNHRKGAGVPQEAQA